MIKIPFDFYSEACAPLAFHWAAVSLPFDGTVPISSPLLHGISPSINTAPSIELGYTAIYHSCNKPSSTYITSLLLLSLVLTSFSPCRTSAETATALTRASACKCFSLLYIFLKFICLHTHSRMIFHTMIP